MIFIESSNLKSNIDSVNRTLILKSMPPTWPRQLARQTDRLKDPQNQRPTDPPTVPKAQRPKGPKTPKADKPTDKRTQDPRPQT